jgi:hypothetical protein
MTEPESIPQMFHISLYCRMTSLCRWDTVTPDINFSLKQCEDEVQKFKGKRSVVLALIRTPLPVNNTHTE